MQLLAIPRTHRPQKGSSSSVSSSVSSSCLCSSSSDILLKHTSFDVVALFNPIDMVGLNKLCCLHHSAFVMGIECKQCAILRCPIYSLVGRLIYATFINHMEAIQKCIMSYSISLFCIPQLLAFIPQYEPESRRRDEILVFSAFSYILLYNQEQQYTVPIPQTHQWQIFALKCNFHNKTEQLLW